MNRTRIKMCGMTSAAEIALAIEAGADAVGIILAPSPCRVDLATLAGLRAEIPAHVEAVSVFVNPSDDEASFALDLDYTLQFSGEESVERCERLAGGRAYIKAIHLDPVAADAAGRAAAYPHAIWMFDTRVDARYGGTGVPFSWDAVVPAARAHPVVVSGGLSVENVATCVRRVRPYGVDVRSGIEANGRKDATKMRAFVRAVRAADAS